MKNKFCSWQSIVIGCILVWFLGMSAERIAYIKERAGMLSVLIVIAFLVTFTYHVIIMKNKDFETIAAFILMGAFLVRILYVLIAPYNITHHDIGVFTNLDSELPQY